MVDPPYQWLLSYQNDIAHPPQRSAEGDVVRVDNEMWRADIRTEKLGDGTVFYAGTADIRRDFEFTASDDYEGPRISSNILLDGQYGHKITRETEHWLTDRQGAIFMPMVPEATSRFVADTHIRLFSYLAPRETVHSMLDGQIPKCFAAYFDDGAPSPHYQLFDMTSPIRETVSGVFSNELTGKLWHLFMEGLLLQLVAHQISALCGDAQASGRETTPDMLLRDQLYAAKELLLKDLGNPPTLSELSSQVGLSEKRLSNGFRDQFGTTVFETLRNERLEHARMALEREDVVLKQVAHRVGYKHVTNFINAFTRHFGQPPRRYLDDNTD